MKLVRLIFFFMLALGSQTGPVFAGDSPTGQTGDWSVVAEEARALGLPVAILFTSPDCGYCERLKRDVIHPAFFGGKLSGRALVKEVSNRTGGKITDFDGERIRFPLFTERYGVFATPTLVLVAPDGEQLAEPLVGYSQSGEYQALLEQALTQATALLKTPERARTLAGARK